MIGNLIDRMIAVFAPGMAAERVAARATLDQINAIANGKGGYNAGKYNRLTRMYSRENMRELQVPRAQIDSLRAQSWDLYRNNPYARKIVRTLETKVIGRGLHPHPLAKTVDGEPFTEFRNRAKQLWWAIAKCFDVRGVPGRGGLDLVELQKLALRSVILSGEVLARPVTVSEKRRQKVGSPIRLMLQMIHADRLSNDEKAPGFADGNDFYRGIELDQNGSRVAYHLKTGSLDELNLDHYQLSRLPASDALHLFVQDDVDQLRGVPWFASALMQFRDTGDLQYNVLKASAMAACFVAGYKLSRGQNRFGTAGSASDSLTDEDGNTISRLQPGMLINLGQDGDLKSISPSQPTTNIEAFIQHLVRGTGAALPGVKASTVTGDYRNSSFSSERSADNDCWPEMESVQDWFATAFCQPLFEEVVTMGVLSGYFSGIVTAEEFEARKSELLDTSWSGPVPRSINPTDDAKAAQMRIANGQSSPQVECEAIGRDPEDVLRDVAEWIRLCNEQQLPEWFIATSLGQTKQPVDQTQQSDQAVSNAQ